MSGEEETAKKLQQKLSDSENEVKKLEAVDVEREEKLAKIKEKLE